MRLYANLARLSTKLIKQFGLPCRIITESNERYEPTTGRMTVKQSAQSAYCLLDRLAYDFPNKAYSSEMVEQGDVLIYLTQRADLNAQIVVNGETWTVIKSQPIQPANQAIIYQCQCRKVN